MCIAVVLLSHFGEPGERKRLIMKTFFYSDWVFKIIFFKFSLKKWNIGALKKSTRVFSKVEIWQNNT